MPSSSLTPAERLPATTSAIPLTHVSQHALTLEVDSHGNVLKSAAVGYGRRTTIRVVGPLGVVLQVPNPGLTALAAAVGTNRLSCL